MPFLTALKVQPIRGTDKRKVLSILVYRDSLLGRVVVPEGFISNYASIPKWIPRWIIDQDDPIIREASVVHDFLYSVESPLDISRLAADGLLYRAMRELKAGSFIAWIAYYSVRLNGFPHWRNK